MDSRATRQVISAGAGLTTPQTGQVVAGTAVAVAAIQGVGPDTMISAPVRVTVDSSLSSQPPDIMEITGCKTQRAAAGVLLALPTDALSHAEEIEIAAVASIDAPGPLPGAFHRI